MNWLSKKLRLSVNTRLFNKNEFEDVEAFIEGWKNSLFTIEELALSVQEGFAYCAELKGKRHSKNFVASDILSVDIDDGMSIEDAKTNDLIKSYATLIYTTASHTAENPRLRIVFVLERTIEDAAEIKAASRSLALRLSGDPSVIDSARLFYGNYGCKYQICDNGIPTDFLQELIEQGRNVQNVNQAYSVSQGGSGRSTMTFPPDLILKTDKGDQQKIDALSRTQPIFCPFHIDKNASAFVTENKQGEKGIHCSTCGSTFWQTSQSDNVDFFSFDRAIKAVQDHAGFSDNPDIVFRQFLDNTTLNNAKASFIHDQYISTINFKPGATFIKSPKGTGKTEFLKNLISGDVGSVLLVGHRRSLIRQMCNRLNLDCYLDDSEYQKHEKQYQYRYGVCLDSIAKIQSEREYDYILIDESEQVLAHFLSDTLSEKRNSVFYKLRHLISNANHIFALDADLDVVSFNFISDWARINNPDRRSKIYINEYNQPKGDLNIFDSKPQIIGDLHRSITQGLRCYVTSNSKKLIHNLEASISKANPKAKIVTATSETITRNEPKVVQFLENPAQEALKYDVILTSPSVSSGVDISFPENEEIFDVVYGIFEPLILTHFECDQQLSRVRHPKSVKVYLAPRRFSFETNFDVVLHDALSLNMMDHLIEGYTHTGKTKYRKDDPLLQLAASIMSYQRASKNKLKRNFLDYKKAQGWNIITVEDDAAVRNEGSIKALEGKNLTQASATEALLKAPKLSDDDFMLLQEKKENEYALLVEEQAAFVRGLIERFYQQDISASLLILDKDGKYRKAVRAFEDIIDNEHWDIQLRMLEHNAETKSDSLYLFSDYRLANIYVAQCLDKAGLLQDREFQVNKKIVSADLGEFVGFLNKTKTKFELIFNQELRRDYRNKPMSQLSNILSNIGLSMKNVGSRKKGGKKKEYVYKIHPSKYQTMLDIVKQRKSSR